MDNSVRGRLLRLLVKVKKFREKKVETEPEPQEDKKPSERRIFCMSCNCNQPVAFVNHVFFRENLKICYKHQ